MKFSFYKILVNTISRGFGALSSLVLSLLIARVGGADMTGYYYSFTAMLAFFSWSISLGDHTLILRKVSHEPTESLSILGGYIRAFSGRMILVIFLVSLMYIFLNVSWLNFLYIDWLALSISAFCMAVIQAYGYYYNGKNQQLIATMFQSQIMPVSLFLIGTIYYYFDFLENNNIPVLFAISYIIVFSISLFCTGIIKLNEVKKIAYLPESNSLKAMGTTLLTHISNWAPTFMLLNLSTQENVGVFNTAIRLTIAATIVGASISAIFAPGFVKEGSKNKLQRMVNMNIRYELFFSSLCLIPVLIFDRHILGLFGDEFIIAIDALWIIALGRMFSSCFGSVGRLLMQRGYFGHQLLATTAGVIVQISFALIFFSDEPVVGMAIAVTCGLITEKLIRTFMAYRLLNVVCFIFTK